MAINPQENLLERVAVLEEDLLMRGRKTAKRGSHERDRHGASSVRKKKVRFDDSVEAVRVANDESCQEPEPMMKGAHTSYEKRKEETTE